MSTYAIRGLSLGGNRVYYHEDSPHWRPTPPLRGHRLPLEETRRLAKVVGGRVVRFTTRAERLERLVRAAQGVVEAESFTPPGCEPWNAVRLFRELEKALRPFLKPPT